MPRMDCEESQRIQAIDRALQIPSVNYLWDKSSEVYGRVKAANIFTNWAFDAIEMMLSSVATKSQPVAVRLMKNPIYNLDKTLCHGIDFVEVKMPIIKEVPKQIYHRTKSLVFESLRPAVQIFVDLKQETKQRVKIITLHTYYKAHYLRVYSWQQADRVMSTETGMNILKRVDDTTGLAELMLDKYLPALEDETFSDVEECSEHAKLHHTMIRLSEFSSRAVRRIYLALMEKMQHMYKIEILILILHALILIQAMKFMETILSTVLKTVADCLTL